MNSLVILDECAELTPEMWSALLDYQPQDIKAFDAAFLRALGIVPLE